MHGNILLRFMNERNYVKSFLAGKLYMNTLAYFWDEEKIDKAKKRKQAIIDAYKTAGIPINPDDVRVPIEDTSSVSGQMDPFEGTIETLRDGAELPDDFKRILAADVFYRAEGYKYCNLNCFYRLDYNRVGNCVTWDMDSRIYDFGRYVMMIQDPDEFIRRVIKASDSLGYKCVCGNVKYHPLKKDGDRITLGRHILLECEGAEEFIDIASGKIAVASKRDCFDKMDNLAYQQEWRIALYRGLKETQAYILDVGPLYDIVKWVKTEKLNEELHDMFLKEKASADLAGYRGNIKREQLKTDFYLLGENKAKLLAICGEAR